MLLCKIYLGNGRFGPIGVGLMHKRRSSKIFLEAVAVTRCCFYGFNLSLNKSI